MADLTDAAADELAAEYADGEAFGAGDILGAAGTINRHGVDVAASTTRVQENGGLLAATLQYLAELHAEEAGR